MKHAITLKNLIKTLGGYAMKNVSIEARYMYFGLACIADEGGVCEADAGYLKSMLFPLDDVAPEKIARLGAELAAKKLITIGRADGRAAYILRSRRSLKRAQNLTPRNAQRTAVHFANERHYTKEELDALITDVDDIDV